MANIIVCADGTWNRPEEDLEEDYPSNVLKLARGIAPEHGAERQHVFYDWGLGSYHGKLTSGATGRGIHKNIVDGYRYIVQNYNPGDRIYLFGFSRGAYTVRALSGLINNCGILKRADAPLIVEAFKIYKSPLSKNHPSGANATAFRGRHAHVARNIHFIGVWDTVGSLGIPFSLMGLLDSHDEFYDTKMGSNVAIARHAVAIDEQRQDFEPTVWQPKSGVDMKQVWFAGVHADVGGSYPPDKRTGFMASDVPMGWMVREVKAAGLGVEGHLESTLTDGVRARLHKTRKHVYRLKRPLHRPLVLDSTPMLIHPSVKARYLADSDYRPKLLQELVEAHGWDALDVGD